MPTKYCILRKTIAKQESPMIWWQQEDTGNTEKIIFAVVKHHRPTIRNCYQKNYN